MAINVGEPLRFGNHAIDPITGQPFAAPPDPFYTAGAATDPGVVELAIQRPDGSQIIYGWPVAEQDGLLEHESTGRFYADVMLDQAGVWRYRLTGSGAAGAVEERSVRVERSRMA